MAAEDVSGPRGNARIPMLVVSCIDPVLRETTVAGVLADVPGSVALRHDLLVDRGLLHRSVFDSAAVLEDEWVRLDHACLSCAMREDLLPTLRRLASERPSAVVLALPVAAEALPAVAALTSLTAYRTAAVVSVFDAEALEADLFGDALLAERELAFTDTDRRSVGETLAHQVEFADVLLTPQLLPPRAAALLDHLVPAEVGRQVLHAADGRELVSRRRSAAAAFRGDPLRVAATGAGPDQGVWTLDVQSWRPFHPERLRDQVQTLGTGALRGRGHFWLPTRPETVCVWDSAGGQVSIGTHGNWTTKPDTHLVITGIKGNRDGLLTAFDTALMDDTELARGLHTWRGRPDGLDPWLGEQPGAA